MQAGRTITGEHTVFIIILGFVVECRVMEARSWSAAESLVSDGSRKCLIARALRENSGRACFSFFRVGKRDLRWVLDVGWRSRERMRMR